MFYNKDNPQWHFNQEQFLSEEEYDLIVGENVDLVKTMLTSDVRDFGEKIYGVKELGTVEEQEAKRKKSMLGIIGGAVVFAGLVLALIFKQILIFGFIACAVFFAAGISMIVTGKGDLVESSSRAHLNRVIGGGMALASLLLVLLMIFRNHFSQAEFFILMAVLVFGIAGLALTIVSILKAFSGKTVYTQEVSATCTGYVRSVSRDETQNHRTVTFINTSPLFSYYYDGVQYEAVWDEFVAKKDSDIALNQTVTIKIDPRHPESILSPVTTHPGGIAFQIIMGLLFVGVAAGLGIYTASGAAEGLTVETSWNPAIEEINGETEPSALQITDEMIEQYYSADIGNKEWYFDTVTVAAKNYTSDGQKITFTDDTFISLLSPDGKAPEPGTELMVFYTIDEDYLESGYKYKRIFTTGKPGEVEYVGSHTSYEG